MSKVDHPCFRAHAALAPPLQLPLICRGRSRMLYSPQCPELSADDVRAAFEKWIRPEAVAQVVRGPAPNSTYLVAAAGVATRQRRTLVGIGICCPVIDRARAGAGGAA